MKRLNVWMGGRRPAPLPTDLCAEERLPLPMTYDDLCAEIARCEARTTSTTNTVADRVSARLRLTRLRAALLACDDAAQGQTSITLQPVRTTAGELAQLDAVLFGAP